jgi:hypothetical protein
MQCTICIPYWLTSFLRRRWEWGVKRHQKEAKLLAQPKQDFWLFPTPGTAHTPQLAASPHACHSMDTNDCQFHPKCSGHLHFSLSHCPYAGPCQHCHWPGDQQQPPDCLPVPHPTHLLPGVSCTSASQFSRKHLPFLSYHQPHLVFFP